MPRQYGGNTPPPGYVQFLVERWPDWQTTGDIGGAPFIVWAEILPRQYGSHSYGPNPCSLGHRISKESVRDLGLRQKNETPLICPCYGRFIE